MKPSDFNSLLHVQLIATKVRLWFVEPIPLQPVYNGLLADIKLGSRRFSVILEWLDLVFAWNHDTYFPSII